MKKILLSKEQKKRVLCALEKVPDDLKQIRELESAEELHQFVLYYNWDDGIDALKKVNSHPKCDRGTALLIYWLSGPAVCEYASRDECPDYYLDLYDYVVDLEEKLLSNYYNTNQIYVDPCNLLFPGDNAIVRRPDNPFRRTPPKELTKPSGVIEVPLQQIEDDYRNNKDNKIEYSEKDDQSSQINHADVKELIEVLEEETEDQQNIRYLKILEKRAKDNPDFEDNLKAFKKKYIAEKDH